MQGTKRPSLVQCFRSSPLSCGSKLPLINYSTALSFAGFVQVLQPLRNPALLPCRYYRCAFKDILKIPRIEFAQSLSMALIPSRPLPITSWLYLESGSDYPHINFPQGDYFNSNYTNNRKVRYYGLRRRLHQSRGRFRPIPPPRSASEHSGLPETIPQSPNLCIYFCQSPC